VKVHCCQAMFCDVSPVLWESCLKTILHGVGSSYLCIWCLVVVGLRSIKCEDVISVFSRLKIIMEGCGF
jgi:hypothetical protein